MDCGIICYFLEEVKTYFAKSNMYYDFFMIYRVADLDEDVILWNDEYPYYRLE